MKRIKMHTLSAGPDGVMEIGKVYSVDDKTAATLVKGGFARYVDPPARQATKPQPPRTATKPQPPSKATKPKDDEKATKPQPPEKAAGKK